MSDYTQSIDFSAKDALASGTAGKEVKGADIDTELGLISTAIATKYDSDDLASQAQAEAGTDNTVLMTPLRSEQHVQNWAGENAGMVEDIQALADPGADRIVFWDDGGSAVGLLTVGSGLDLTGTTLTADDANIDHDALTNFDANEHVDHTAVDITAGAGLTGGGDISATRTLNVGAGNGITVNANDVALTDAAATTTNPIDISSGTVDFDITALTNIEGNALAATDEFIVDDGGVPKAVRYQDAGLIVNSAISTTKTFTDAEMNQVWQLSGGTDRQWDLDTGVGVQGNFIIMIQTGTGSIDLSGGTATINSALGDFTAQQDSVIVGINVGSDVWQFYGDMAAS